MGYHSDEVWLQQIRRGDLRAYESLFHEWYQPLCNYANTFLKDPDEAEEMVQNTFVTIWHKREEIQVKSTLQAYLYRAVNNACLNRLRHLKVRKEHESHVTSSQSLAYEHTAQAVISKELTLHIQQAVSELPETCREVFQMSRFDGLTYPEIAEVKGVSVKAIEKQMGKALRLLREKLSDYLPLILVYLSDFKL